MAFLNTVKQLHCASKRLISTSSVQCAGFQGFQGEKLSPEQREKKIFKKKRRINQLKEVALELKPITDFYTPYSWTEDDRIREVKEISSEELERRSLLEKEWSRYTHEKSLEADKKFLRLKSAQLKALKQLKDVSNELYEAAIKPDLSLMEFSMYGPTETPPDKSYIMPLGTLRNYEKVL